MRGRPVRGHGVVPVTTFSPSPSSGIGADTSMVAGITRCRSASTVLITPATPDAASRWPMLDFTEPTRHGRSRSAPYTSASAPAPPGAAGRRLEVSGVGLPGADRAWPFAAGAVPLGQPPRLHRVADPGPGAAAP